MKYGGVGRQLKLWRTDGILTEEQYHAIRRHEGMEAAEGVRSIPVVAEAFAYIGGALAVGAVVALIAAFWGQLGVAGRIVLPAVAAVALLVGGWAVGRQGSPAARRLEQVLLTTGIAAVGLTAGITAYEILVATLGSTLEPGPSNPQSWAMTIGFTTTAVVGLIAWRLRPFALIIAEAGAAVVFAVMSSFDFLMLGAQYAWVPGAAMMVVGAVWCGLGLLGVIHPETPVLAVGGLAVVFGAQILGGEQSALLWTALVIDLAVVVAGALLRRFVLIAYGAVGLVLVVAQTIAVNYQGQIIAPIVLLAAGVLLIAAAGTAQWRAAVLNRSIAAPVHR